MMIGSYTAAQREMLALFYIETFSSSTNHSYSGVRLGSPLAVVIDKAGFNSSKRARPAWASVNLCRQWLWVQLTHVFCSLDSLCRGGSARSCRSPGAVSRCSGAGVSGR